MTVGYVLDRWVELSQTFVLEEVRELEAQGTRVAVLALHRGSSGPPSPVPATYLRDAPAGRVHALAHLRWLLRSPRRYVAFRAAVRRHPTETGEMAWKRLPWAALRLQEQGVDRLHAHFAWAGAAAAEALSALTGWPWALTTHARDIYAPRPAVVEKLSRCTLLVTVCDYNVRLLRERYGLTRAIALVVCGVAVPDVRSRSAPECDVVAVGRLVEKKGFDVLLRAFAEVARDRPRSTLRIIGEGPQRAELEAQVDALGLRDNVELAGAVPHDEVLAAVAASAVLCLPARVAKDGDADSMPLVVKEAMAREVPVVVTPVGGLPELVDEQVGLVVPPDDPGALAVALDKLLGDEQLRTRLGRAGRERVLARFTLHGEVTRLRRLLADLR